MIVNRQTISLLIIFLSVATKSLYAQKIDKNDLCNTWHLDKYADEKDYYKIPKAEQGDYIEFKKDMTFQAKSEGAVRSGTWMLNKNGTYIELKNKDGSIEKIYILYATPRTIVVTYDEDDYRDLEAHYVSCL